MPWVFFVIAFAAIAVAFRTHSIGMAMLCLFAALGLIIAGVLKLAAARLSSVSRSETGMLDPKLVQSVRAKSKKDGGGGEFSVESGGGRQGRDKSDDGGPDSGGSRSNTDAAADGGGDGGGGGGD